MAHRVYQAMSQGTGHPRLEDRLESREPYVVQLGRPNPCVGEMQMLLVTLLKLHGLVSKFVARRPHVQKVIRGIREEPHCRIRAGPTQHTYVPTLEGVGPGHPPSPSPLHLRQVGVHARVH